MKVFRDLPSSDNQVFLLPPSVGEFVGENAPVRIFSEAVDDLDTSILYSAYKGGGAPAYDPVMLAKIIMFGFSTGLRSSRRLAMALEYDLRFMWLAKMSRPDYRTIARFRRTHQYNLVALFRSSVQACMREGLVLLEDTAIDGTKIEANVSGKETVKVERLDEAVAKIDAKIARIMQEARIADETEDAQLGEARGDEVLRTTKAQAELPDDVKEPVKALQRRKQRFLKAKEEAAKTKQLSVAATDPDSRVMKTRAGNRPAYNAQAAVDGANQIIVAAKVTQDATDELHLEPMVEEVKANTGAEPARTEVDSGYQSIESLEYAERANTDVYIGQPSKQAVSNKPALGYNAETDEYVDDEGHVYRFWKVRLGNRTPYRVYRCAKLRDERWIRQDDGLLTAMREKLASPEGRAIYRLRQQIVEPVFGQLKGIPNMRRFLLRGLAGATAEFMLAATAHNLGKMVRSRMNRRLQAA